MVSEVGLALHVAQLAGVVFVTGLRGPAQEDVAGRLHQPLAGHHPVPLVAVLDRFHKWGEDGRPRLLDLQQQGVLAVAGVEQHDVQRVPTLPTPTTFRAKSTNR